MVRIKVLGNFQRLSGLEFEYEPGFTFVCDPSCADYDWLVVFDELPVSRVELACSPSQTILCTWEPVTIKSYSRRYTRQFGHLLTNRPPEAEGHPHYHLGRGYFPQFVSSLPSSSEEILAAKREQISTVCSSKRMRHTQHNARFELISALARAIPGFSWYGHGVRPLEKKEDALLPYRYHVAVENHIAANHWTEKLSDPILCECLTFYAGDPEIGEVLPPEAIIRIPIDDPQEAVKIIRAAIADGAYEKHRSAVLEAKRLIVTKYNLWAQVIAVVKSASSQALSDRPRRVIYSRKDLRWHDPAAALEDVWLHLKRGFK